MNNDLLSTQSLMDWLNAANYQTPQHHKAHAWSRNKFVVKSMQMVSTKQLHCKQTTNRYYHRINNHYYILCGQNHLSRVAKQLLLHQLLKIHTA